MRVAYLIDTFSSDKAGTEKQLLNVIRRLGSQQTVICLHQSPWLSRNSLPCDTVTLGYGGFLDPAFPLVLARYLLCLKRRKIDLVQTFFEDSMFVGWLGRMLSGKRHALIVSRRDLGLGSDEPGYHRLFRMVRPLVLRSCDGIAVNAHAIKGSVMADEKVAAEKIAVIPNGIDIPAPPPAPPALFTEFRADLWLCLTANLKPVKRVDLVLKALAHLKQKGGQEVVRTVILGEGRLRSQLVQMAADAGIGDRVHFVGAVENVSDYLHCADVGVLCSDREGLPNAILEYMACGLPVVATDAGGARELVDRTNGACVPAGDHLALAQALAGLLAAPQLRKDLGARSLEKVRGDYTWDKIIPRWESYHESIAKALAIGDAENAHAKA